MTAHTLQMTFVPCYFGSKTPIITKDRTKDSRIKDVLRELKINVYDKHDTMIENKAYVEFKNTYGDKYDVRSLAYVTAMIVASEQFDGNGLAWSKQLAFRTMRDKGAL